MNAAPVCCEPCEVLRYCEQERNCCLECHCSYEETLALPYLPPELQDRLRREHAWLENNGFPPDAVAAHAAWEEAAFRQYCPPEVCEIIESDHVAHGHGRLLSRVQFPSRNNGMFSPRWGGVSGTPNGTMFSARWASAAMVR